MSKDFFDESLEQSKIKSEIVAKYFPAWAKIILAKGKGNIAYIDLFSGPGRYKDGTESTPLLILKNAISDNNIRDRFISIFTDKNPEYVKLLRQEVEKITGIELLRNKPKVYQEEIGEKIVEILNEMKLIPSLVFLDPCGYKGLSLELINSVIKDWACEYIFFFNYVRINAGIYNDRIEEHINRIFGEKRAHDLRCMLKGKTPYKREKLILSQLIIALRETHGKYVQKFCIKHQERDRTSHYLVFVTKKVLGYEIMKEIMAKYSSYEVQGVPSFEYNRFYEPNLYDKPFDELKETLLNEFAGQTLSVYNIYKSHSPGTNYIKKNYKQVLIQLVEENKVEAMSPSGKKRRRYTMGDKVKIIFPS